MATGKSFKADVSSVSPSSEGMTEVIPLETSALKLFTEANLHKKTDRSDYRQLVICWSTVKSKMALFFTRSFCSPLTEMWTSSRNMVGEIKFLWYFFLQRETQPMKKNQIIVKSEVFCKMTSWSMFAGPLCCFV